MVAFYITAWQTWSPSCTRRQKRFFLRSQMVQFNPIPVFGAKKKIPVPFDGKFSLKFPRNGIKALMVSCRGQRKPELRPDWSSPHFSAISIHHFHIAQNTPFYPKRLHKHPYRIYSINRPGRLFNFWTLRVGAYSRLGAY